jgi:hypothetical protein
MVAFTFILGAAVARPDAGDTSGGTLDLGSATAATSAVAPHSELVTLVGSGVIPAGFAHDDVPAATAAGSSMVMLESMSMGSDSGMSMPAMPPLEYTYYHVVSPIGTGGKIPS